MNSRSFNRRQFIKTSAAATAVSSVASLWSTATSSGAERSPSSRDRPTFAAIGVGDEGRAITSVKGAEWWRGKGACAFADPVVVCDVDRRRAEAAQAAYGGKATIYEYLDPFGPKIGVGSRQRNDSRRRRGQSLARSSAP